MQWSRRAADVPALDVETEGAKLLPSVVGDALRTPRRHPHPVDAEVRHHALKRIAGLVLDAVERAVQAVPGEDFPVDVTFPGESEPDQVDAWISAYAEPFYIRP